MCESRVLFVKQFLARLSSMGFRTIPINDDNFKNGVASMADILTGMRIVSGQMPSGLRCCFSSIPPAVITVNLPRS